MKIISHGHNTSTVAPSSTNDDRIEQMRSELNSFELGRFLTSNLGLNGYWTSYVLLYPDNGRVTRLSSDGTPLTQLESWLLDRCPIILATQERFRIFRRLTQPLIHAGMQLASIPSGLMDDLLGLNYLGAKDVVLTAVDLDPASLRYAQANYERSGQLVKAEFEQLDAWNLASHERWDLVTSNGLNIYIEDNDRCADFYRSIAQALRPNGTFIVSFITPPEEWHPFNYDDLAYQRFLFREVVPAKWQCVRNESLTRSQLVAAGFDVITIEYDKQRMFPAVVARKRADG